MTSRASCTRATAAALALTATLPLGAGCGSADEVGGCWRVVDGERTIAFFIDTDSGEVTGAESIDGDPPVRTDFAGRWEETSSGHRIDAECTAREPGGCAGVARWSMLCSLTDEDTLACVGAPFAGETALDACQGSATVPVP
jgi:hypothetical protein